jgi:hypothetical protein
MFWGMNSVVNGRFSLHCETRERVKAIRKGKNERKDRNRGSGQPFFEVYFV